MTSYYLGLLSGTSVDGIDVGLWSFNASNQAKLIHPLSYPIPQELKEKVSSLKMQGNCHLSEIGILDRTFGMLFGEACLELLKQANLASSRIEAIGSHGQTLWHQPTGSSPFTLQIGDPNLIANITGIETVADFRRADVAMGGQGAPLAPAFHAWGFRSLESDRIVLNLGGIANISVLPKNLQQPVLGYDTGPGNGLMDAWIKLKLNRDYDKNGDFAAQGTVNAQLLDALLQCPYFSAPYPKSTGKDFFNLNWVQNALKNRTLSNEDIQATLTALTAVSVSQAIKLHFNDAEVYICGGGVHNRTLIGLIEQALGSNYSIKSVSELGIEPDWMESALFAWLARQRIQGHAIDLSTITGSRGKTILGGLYRASPPTQ